MRIACTIAMTGLLAACSTTQVQEGPDHAARYAAARQQAMAEMIRNFERVHFAFDSAVISTGSLESLARNVELMNAFDEIQVEVQGHCDERGTVEYNLALGQRRADAIRKYMVTAGVSTPRMTTVSYGEEKPLESASNSGAWTRNRRAEFRLRIGPETIRGSTDERIARIQEVEALLAAHTN